LRFIISRLARFIAVVWIASPRDSCVQPSTSRSAIEFTRGVSASLTPADVGRIYLATGAWLAASVTGRDGAVALLRSLADSLERGDDQVRPN
jgi:hypothetical protein